MSVKSQLITPDVICWIHLHYIITKKFVLPSAHQLIWRRLLLSSVCKTEKSGKASQFSSFGCRLFLGNNNEHFLCSD